MLFKLGENKNAVRIKGEQNAVRIKGEEKWRRCV